MELKKNVISFMNMKGGVAKTTLSVNIASYLADVVGKKVLFIDMDPQFNATQYLFNYYKLEYFDAQFKKAYPTVTDVFASDSLTMTDIVEERKNEDKNLITDLSENLSIIPGDLELIRLDFGDRGKEQDLLNFLVEDSMKNNYDYIFIDSAPTYSFYTLATYIASDYYLIPVKPDHFSGLGISLFHNAFSGKAKQYRTTVEHLGIIYTIVERTTNLARDVMTELNRKYGRKVFNADLKKATQIPNGVEDGKLMHNLDQDSQHNIKTIVDEFLERMEN